MTASPAEEELLMDVVDSHSGMITRAAAARELSEQAEARRIVSATELMRHEATSAFVNIEDMVYRIFNKVPSNPGTSSYSYRKIVIGAEPSCITMTLWNRHADYMDQMEITAGSALRITNARLLANGKEPELSSTSGTVFTLVNRHRVVLTELSALKPGQRGLTIFSKILAMGKHGKERRGGRELNVFYATLSDGKTEMPASFIGSSSETASESSAGSSVIIENCAVSGLTVAAGVVAGEHSRVLIKRIQT